MRSGKCLNNRETYFVNSVSNVINFIGKEVIRDYSQSTSTDTERSIDKGFGNTGRQCD